MTSSELNQSIDAGTWIGFAVPNANVLWRDGKADDACFFAAN